MVRAELRTKYKTNYHLELIDPGTGRVKQEADTGNVFTTGWWNAALYTYGSGGAPRFVSSIYLGSGNGTPSESDTGMFRNLWSVGSDYENRTADVEKKSIHVVAGATFPATSSYTGTVTEIGIWSNVCGGGSSWPTPIMMTHALLKDAEGQPLAIVKSDTDILKVTVTLDISYSVSSPWLPVKYPGYLLSVVRSSVLRNQWVTVYFSLGTTCPDPATYGNNYGPYVLPHPTAFVGPAGSMNRAAKTMTFPTTRVPVETAKNRPIYYCYVIFSGFCYARLPNADIFPEYTIPGIHIGTGDGSRKKYDNPLNYFVKDSETVYKNGAALVRGVDYTIDYRNNVMRLPELAATNNARLSGGVKIGATTYNGHKQMLFQRMVNDTNAYLVDEVPVGWKAGEPLVVRLQEPGDVNTFYCPAWVAAGTVTVSCSDNGDVWAEVCSFDHVNGTANKAAFDLVNAQYWKIEGTNTNWTAHSFTTDDAGQEVFLGYLGDPYITFTEAPGEGAVLTMDVVMDRPFKNGNFVIDMSAQLQMG